MMARSFLALLSVASAGSPDFIVDLRPEKIQNRIAAQVCSGLFNRDDGNGVSAYVLMNDWDIEWLKDVEGVTNPSITSTSDFLAACLGAKGPARGFIRYNASSQQLILPNIVTLAAVIDAVPLEEGDPSAQAAEMVFDSLKEFDGFDELEATRYMYEHHIGATTTMAKLNPGIDTSKPRESPLVRGFDAGLVDWIVKRRLFTFFMPWNCIPGTKQHRLQEEIVKNNPWPKPIAVYGYDDSFSFLGNSWFEAETYCSNGRSMGQIASSSTNNLGFFSRKPRISSPLKQNADPLEVYNHSTTYLTLIVGDGDNVNYVKESRRKWMKQRVAMCEESPDDCFPLVWTLSPQIQHMAPDWARWYFNQSLQTGKDYFILPPSGDLYAYASAIKNVSEREQFVRNTEQDCYLYNTSGSVMWEYMGSWGHAIKDYFPMYAERSIVRGIFPVNDLFLLPIFKFAPWEDFKVFGEDVVMFKQFEWRGENPNPPYPTCKHNPMCIQSYLSAGNLAEKINDYPRGSVHQIYLTSDGGGDMDTLFRLASLLDSHVKIVNHNTIVDMALASRKHAGEPTVV